MRFMWAALAASYVFSAWAISSFLERAGVEFTPWHWLGLFAWLLITFFGVAVVWTFLSEREARAAGVGAVLFGAFSLAAALVLLALAKIL